MVIRKGGAAVHALREVMLAVASALVLTIGPKSLSDKVPGVSKPVDDAFHFVSRGLDENRMFAQLASYKQ